MRTFTHLLKAIFLAVLLGNATSLKAQTIELYAFDSTGSYCSLPVNTVLNVGGNTTGYTTGDLIDIDVYYGDGTNESASVPLSSWSGFTFFNTSFSHTFTLPGIYNIMIIATGPDGTDDTLVHLMVVADTCGNVTGHTYLDQNGNCVFDGGDDTLRYSNVYLNSVAGTTTVFTDGNGFYSFNVPAGMSYTLSFPVSGGLASSCPVSGTYSFTSTTGTQVFNFGVVCSPGFDFIANGTSVPFVPGQFRTFSVCGNNLSCTEIPATLTVTLDPLLTYTGASISPTSVSGSTLTWNFTSLPCYTPTSWWLGSFCPQITALTSTLATPGDSLCITVTVTPSAGDANPSNNTYTFCVPVLASYDPNMKEVSPKGIGPEGYVAPDAWFDYTIHFQNTGTFQAFDIHVIDTISTHLDMSTFEIMGASHAMTPYITNGNIIKFDFPGINLPDSTSNEPASHGWIKYRIKAKTGLANGTEIRNTAHIFFDYNPAVVTNTTLNTIDIALGVKTPEAESKTFMVYPNPSGTYVNINAPGAEGSTAVVYDATGKVVTAISLTGAQAVLDVGNWTNGLYEIVIPESGFRTVRFQKMD